MKSCFVYQPQGLGDIIFVQKIVHHYKSLGYRIIFPIIEHYKWAIPYFEQSNVEFVVLTNDRKVIEPFEHSDQITYLMQSTDALFRRPVHALDFVYLSCGPSTIDSNEMMTSKYAVSDVDYNDWQKYVKINRNIETEYKLFYDILGLSDGEKYTLINEKSSSEHISINDAPGKNMLINLIFLPSFFDWIMVIKNASRIITIDTSICYLAEVYCSKNIDCYIINRYNTPSFVDLPKIFKLPWKYCLNSGEVNLNANI